MTTNQKNVTETLSITAHSTARVIANFAWQHLKAASTFRDHVVELEHAHSGQEFGAFFENIRSYASGCIMSASASLEALINEFFITPDGPLRRNLQDFESEFWGRGGIERKSPLEKYQIALEMLGQPRLNEHQPIYRNAWALVELRNALVHFKPTWDPDRRRKVELVEILSGTYPTSPFVGQGSDFVTMQCMSAGCANWAISTSVAFIREFHDRAQLDQHKIAAFLKFGT
jgi:hypothetical protein